MQASLLRKSPRHTHAQPHTEKLVEGKVQEMGPDCLQVAMAWMAMFGGSQCIFEAGSGAAAALGCLKVRCEALQDGLLAARSSDRAQHPFPALGKGSSGVSPCDCLGRRYCHEHSQPKGQMPCVNPTWR